MSKIIKFIILILALALVSTNTIWIMSGPLPAQPEKVAVRFAYQHGYHYGQQIIMDHFNLVEKWSGGVAVASYQIIKGGSAQLEAMIGGSLEFGSMGPAPVVKAVSRGVEVKIFASMGRKEGMIWTWREDINSLVDLQSDDKVNVQAVNGIYHIGLMKAFIEEGRTIDDVNEIAMFYSHPDAYQLMEQKEIDVVFASPPYNTIYKDAGYKFIGDEASIWGTPTAGSTLICRVNFCEENPNIAAAVYMAWLEATNWINSNPEETSKIIGKVYGYDLDEVWREFQDANLVFNPTFGLSALEDYAGLLYDLGIIDKQLSEQDMIFEHSLGVIGR